MDKKKKPKSAKKKVQVKDLKAKNAGKVKGGAYLKIGDVKGESTDQDHKDWIAPTR